MAGTIHEPRISPGDLPSAESWNRIVRALAQGVTGMRVVAGSDGIAIIPGTGSGSDLKVCVLRTVDLVTPLLEVQQVIEQPGEAKLTGEDGQRYHIGAVGGVFEAYPLIGGTYAQYNIQGAVRPVVDIVPPENLSGAALFTYNSANQLTLMYRWAENIGFIDPEATEAGGGGV